MFVEDFSAAVDFIGTRPFVDNERIGVIGICGSGSFGLSAAQVDRRIKAIATVSMYDISRMQILPILKELGIGFVPFSPLGKGLLSGKIDAGTTEGDIRNVLPRFQGKARIGNQQLVAAVGAIAQRRGATPAQVALAWLLAQETWIVPIPGTTMLPRLQENVGAAQVQLTDDELSEIGAVLASLPVYGTRNGEGGMKLVGL